MKTAVEWLGHEINKIYTEFPDQLFYDVALLLQKAKEMEKEQIMDAYNIRARIDGILTYTDNRTSEQYYNETFKSE
jgi:hypothetical protein